MGAAVKRSGGETYREKETTKNNGGREVESVFQRNEFGERERY